VDEFGGRSAVRRCESRLAGFRSKTFAPSVTPRRDLQLVITGDSFRWELKGKQKR
jgi:hypothetical protein